MARVFVFTHRYFSNDDRVEMFKAAEVFRANDTFVVGFITVPPHLIAYLLRSLITFRVLWLEKLRPFHDTTHSSHMLKFMTSFRSHEIKPLGFIFCSNFFPQYLDFLFLSHSLPLFPPSSPLCWYSFPSWLFLIAILPLILSTRIPFSPFCIEHISIWA